MGDKSMSDGELVELAARAAGYWSAEYGCPDRLPHRAWNPLNNDGDALLLAIRLRLHVEPGNGMVRVLRPGREIGFGKAPAWEPYDERYGAAYAVRRAIVKAAAMLEGDAGYSLRSKKRLDPLPETWCNVSTRTEDAMPSAKKAAQALLQYDATLADQIAALPDSSNDRARAFWKLMVEVRGTWTLGLAAAAAGQTEEAVMGALSVEASVRSPGQRSMKGHEHDIYNPDSNPHFWAWLNGDA